jgi:hypothetical protein
VAHPARRGRPDRAHGDRLGIDVLTLDADGRVRAIWVLADELQRILQVQDNPEGRAVVGPWSARAHPRTIDA